MIGNLFSAVSIAILSGVFAIGGVKADEVERVRALTSQGTSLLTGNECDIIYSGKTTLNLYLDDTLSHYTTYDLSGNSVDGDDDESFSVLMYQDYLDFAYNYCDTYDAPVFTFAYQLLPQPVVVGSARFTMALRVGVSYSSEINGFEFRFDDDCMLSYYDYTNYTDIMPPNYAVGGKTYVNAVGVYQPNTASSLGGDSPLPLPTATIGTYQPLVLSQYVFLFHETGAHATTRTSVSLEYQFINGSTPEYQSGYNVGYATGYSSGHDVGWGEGYQQGLATAQQGTFSGLFNAIADTPLRFLYGLFNFDLFGMSVLVIILSLLTGIIVFGLVKHFWK